MKPTAVLLLWLSILGISHQTVDLNLRQLQFVSDHLTTKECRHLITALYQKSFQLKPKQLRPVKDKEPCLLHLTDWNTQTGDKATVEDLALRLHQIGRQDIAREISRAVYGETALAIHKFFLDDPFKATAHHPGSRLIEDDDEEDDKKRKKEAVDSLREAYIDRRFGMAVVCLTLTLTLISCSVMVVYCPASFHSMCPKGVVATFEAALESVKENLSILKTLTATEAFGMKKEQVRRRPQQAAAAHREEQDRLVQSILAI